MVWKVVDRYSEYGSRSEKQVEELGLISAIASWCEFLHNKETAVSALKQIANALGADVVSLSRVPRQGGRDHNIIAFDKAKAHRQGPALNSSFARAVLGSYIDKPKSGSIWLKSMLEDDVDPALTIFHKNRGLTELAVVTLDVSEKSVDFIEIHFAHKLKFDDYAILNLAAQTFSRTWRNRSPGVFTERMLRHRERNNEMPIELPILSSENPARLSRAEYRVCLMLSHGRTIENAQKELGVSMPTVRTHLKNIYAKTNTSGHSELLFQLLTYKSLTPASDSLRRSS